MNKQTLSAPKLDKYDLNHLFKLRDTLEILKWYYRSEKTLKEIEEEITKDLRTYTEAKNGL